MSKAHWIDLIYKRRATEAVRLPEDAVPRLQRLAGIRAVVFDVYDTLFSSGVGDISLAAETNRDAALKATLEVCGLPNRFTASDSAWIHPLSSPSKKI